MKTRYEKLLLNGKGTFEYIVVDTQTYVGLKHSFNYNMNQVYDRVKNKESR